MCTSVMEKINTTDIFISVAAVADYYLQNFSKNKIKKINDSYQLMLHKTPDILAKVAALDNAPFTVGFAAETEDLKFNAIEKLRSKNLNMIAANQVGGTIGIDSEENALSVFWKSGEMKFPQNSKNKLARDLIKLIASRYNEKNSNKTH